MNILKLDGLSGSHPLGAMAAFGLLRILDREQPFGHGKLSWAFDSDWKAVLHVQSAIDNKQLIEFLIQRQPSRVEAPWLTWNDDIKSKVPAYQVICEKVVMDLLSEPSTERTAAQEFAEFLTCFGSELVTAKSKPEVKPTAFHMTAGQQRFLKLVKQLADSLDPTQRSAKRQTEADRLDELQQAYRTALFGPWTYDDSHHSLGWDPATEGLYALSDRSPSDSGPSSVRAAVWLGFESLPLFPAVPMRNRLVTTGFDSGGQAMRWPIWDRSIDYATLASLVALPELYSHPLGTKKLHQRGIQAVMQCRCDRDSKGRGTLRNSVGEACEQN